MPQFVVILIRFVLLALLLNMSSVMAKEKFDHFQTGFPLTGSHSTVDCAACHLKGIFKGTPQRCEGCHNSQIAPGKSAKHISSNNICDNCHTEFSWDSAALDHGAVMGGCRTCHNGVTATGKHARHVNTAAVECDGCHGTLAWSPARFDHDLAVGTCSSCHNGVTSIGKPGNHISTAEDCVNCHSTRGWIPARGFNHENAAGRCNSAGCHSLPGKHISVNGQCDNCHRTTGWNPPYKVDHDFVIGTCASCHLDEKLATHLLIIDAECDACHRPTLGWNQTYRVDHSKINEAASCLPCHTNDFDVEKHPGFGVTQLQNCLTADCHQTPRHTLTRW